MTHNVLRRRVFLLSIVVIRLKFHEMTRDVCVLVMIVRRNTYMYVVDGVILDGERRPFKLLQKSINLGWLSIVERQSR